MIDIKKLKYLRLNQLMLKYKTLKSDCVKNQNFEKAIYYRDKEKYFLVEMGKIYKN